MSTQAYVDLMFAWGHARLGAKEPAWELVAEAADVLRVSQDAAHEWLLTAFSHRIEAAIAGHAHAGPLPAALTDELTGVDDRRRLVSLKYVVDRMRQLSRILEPDERVDPYLPWKKFKPTLHPLESMLADGQAHAVPGQYEELRRQAEWSGDPIEASQFHGTMLQFRGAIAELLAEPILSAVETFATQMLTRGWADHPNAGEWFKRHRSRPKPSDGKTDWDRYHADAANPGAWVEDTVYVCARNLLESAFQFAEAIARRDRVERLTEHFLGLETGSRLSASARRRLGATANRVSRTIVNLGLRELGASSCNRLSAERLLADMVGGRDEPMQACLGLARLNQWLDRPEPVLWALARTRERLARMQNPGIQASVISEYVELGSRFDWTECGTQLRALIGVLPRLPNTFTTAKHYSRLHVVIAEQLVLAIATDNFAPAADVRRSMSGAEIASRREALVEVRGKLIEWGQKDWDPVKSS
jgi:hypothetical protein